MTDATPKGDTSGESSMQSEKPTSLLNASRSLTDSTRSNNAANSKETVDSNIPQNATTSDHRDDSANAATEKEAVDSKSVQSDNVSRANDVGNDSANASVADSSKNSAQTSEISGADTLNTAANEPGMNADSNMSAIEKTNAATENVEKSENLKSSVNKSSDKPTPPKASNDKQIVKRLTVATRSFTKSRHPQLLYFFSSYKLT